MLSIPSSVKRYPIRSADARSSAGSQASCDRRLPTRRADFPQGKVEEPGDGLVHGRDDEELLLRAEELHRGEPDEQSAPDPR